MAGRSKMMNGLLVFDVVAMILLAAGAVVVVVAFKKNVDVIESSNEKTSLKTTLGGTLINA